MLSREDFCALEKMMRTVVSDNNEVLRAEMSGMKEEIRTEMSDMKKELREEFKKDMSNMKEDLRAEFKKDMSDMKGELREEFKKDMSDMKEELKKDIGYTIKERIGNSESFLLDEMERYYLLANKDIQELKVKVNRIDQYYSGRRLEDDERNLKLQHLEIEVNCMKERLAM